MKQEDLKDTFEAALQEMRTYQEFFKESQSELLRQLQEVMQGTSARPSLPGNDDFDPKMPKGNSCDRFTSTGTTEWALNLIGKLPVERIRKRMLMHASLFDVAEARGEGRVAAFHAWAIIEGLVGELMFPLVAEESTDDQDMADGLIPFFEQVYGTKAKKFAKQLSDSSTFFLHEYPTQIFVVSKWRYDNVEREDGLASGMVFVPARDIQVDEKMIGLRYRSATREVLIRAGFNLKDLFNGSTGGLLIPAQQAFERGEVDLEECIFVMTKRPRLTLQSTRQDFVNYKVGFGKGNILELGEKTGKEWMTNNMAGPWWFRVVSHSYRKGPNMANVLKIKPIHYGWGENRDFGGITIKGFSPWDSWNAKPAVTWLHVVTRGLLSGQRPFGHKKIEPTELTKNIYTLRNQHAHNSIVSGRDLNHLENLRQQFEQEWKDIIRYLCANWPKGRNCAVKSLNEMR